MAQGTRDWSRKRPLIRYTTGDDVDELAYRINQKIDEIRDHITSTTDDIEATITSTAADIQSTINTTAANIQSTIETTASETSDAIVSIVSDTMHRLGEYAHTYPTGRVIQRVVADEFFKGGNFYPGSSSASYELILTAGRFSPILMWCAPGTTTSDYADIRVVFPATYTGRVGVEVNYAHASYSSECYVFVNHFDGSYERWYGLRYIPATSTFYAFNSDGTWRTISSSVYLPAITTVFHAIKLVIDCDVNEYVRAMIGDYSFTSIPAAPRIVGSSSYRYMTFIVGTGRYTPGTLGILFDSLIATVNEE